MNRLLSILAALVACLALPALASAQDSLLSAEQAFQITAVQQSAHRVQLTWTIAPGYAVYRDRLQVTPADNQVVLGALTLPTGYVAGDPVLGLGPTYEHGFTVSIPYTISAGSTAPALAVSVTGCHHIEPLVCYPPYRVRVPIRVTTSVAPAS